MTVQATKYRSLIQVDLTAPRSYASTAREFIGKIKVPEFPSSEWSKGYVLPGSPNYRPISMAKIEPIRITSLFRYEHVDVMA